MSSVSVALLTDRTWITWKTHLQANPLSILTDCFMFSAQPSSLCYVLFINYSSAKQALITYILGKPWGSMTTAWNLALIGKFESQNTDVYRLISILRLDIVNGTLDQQEEVLLRVILLYPC